MENLGGDGAGKKTKACIRDETDGEGQDDKKQNKLVKK